MCARTAVVKTKTDNLSFDDIGNGPVGAVHTDDAKAQNDVMGCATTIEAHASSQKQGARDEDQLHALNTSL